jgi:FAD synthetase
MGEGERLAQFIGHPLVTFARLGGTEDKYAVLEEVRPDVILLGYDQRSFTERLAEELVRRKIEARILRAESYLPSRFKTSLLRRAPEVVKISVREQGIPL